MSSKKCPPKLEFFRILWLYVSTYQRRYYDSRLPGYGGGPDRGSRGAHAPGSLQSKIDRRQLSDDALRLRTRHDTGDTESRQRGSEASNPTFGN